MAGGLKTVVVPAPAGGVDLDTGYQYVPATRGAMVHNFLPGRPGKLEARGALDLVELPGTAAALAGLWRNGSRILVGRPASTYTWDAAVGGAPAVMASKLIKASYVSYGDSVYGIPNSAGGATCLYRWYLSTGTETVDEIANSPAGGLAVTTHLDRLFVIGGSEPGTTTPVTTRTLWWTDPLEGSALPATLDAWKDDASGLVNQVQLDGAESDYGVGFARINGALAIMRRRSVDMLTGQTPENFSQRRAMAARGCTSTLSIVEYGSGCYYMSEDGLVWFDGYETKVQSDAINSTLLTPYADLEKACVEVLPRDFLFLSVPSPYVGVETLRYLLHIPSGAWSTVSHANPWSDEQTMALCVWDGESPGPVFGGADTLALGNITVPG